MDDGASGQNRVVEEWPTSARSWKRRSLRALSCILAQIRRGLCKRRFSEVF
jgi:hypothetical protein